MYPRNLLDGVAIEALQFVRTNIVIVFGYAVALAVLEGLFWIIIPPPAGLLLTAVSTLLMAVFAVALHRHILSDEIKFPPVVDQRLLIFISIAVGQSFVCGLMLGGLILAALPVISGIGVGGILSVILLVPMLTATILWFASKTLMFFPHAAVTPIQSLRLGAVWHMSNGLIASIALRLAVFIGILIFVFAIFDLLLPINFEQEGIPARVVASPAYVLHSCLLYLTSACFVALASLIYRRAVDDLQAQSKASIREPGA